MEGVDGYASAPLGACPRYLWKKLVVMGGNENGTVQSTAMELHKSGKWKQLPPLKYACTQLSGITIDEEIFAIGGYDEDGLPIQSVQIFNRTTWQDGPSLPYTGYHPFALIIPEYLALRLYFSQKFSRIRPYIPLFNKYFQ